MRNGWLGAWLCGAALAALPFDGPCVEPVDLDPARAFAEPSGLAFHPARGTIFVVDDEGWLAELDGTGRRGFRAVHLGHDPRSRDLEGVTVGPGGRLYVVEEGSGGRAPVISVVDPERLVVERRLRLETTLGRERVICLTPGAGIEGICYAPEVGRFFAVNQHTPARLVEIEVPRAGIVARVRRVVADLDRSVECASDIAWDAASGHLLVTSSSFRGRPGKLFELTLEGSVVRERRLPGRDQEGFCIDADGVAYVACDSGGVLRCAPWRGGAAER